MDLIEKYETKLQDLEAIVNTYYNHNSKEYENITAYFNLICRGIKALKTNEFSNEEAKSFQINSINASFKTLESKIDEKRKK